MSDIDEEIRGSMRVLARNVRRLMEEKGFTHESLAAASGLSMRSVGYVLRPDERKFMKSSPTIDTLWKLSQALDVEAWTLMATPEEVQARLALIAALEQSAKARENARLLKAMPLPSGRIGRPRKQT